MSLNIRSALAFVIILLAPALAWAADASWILVQAEGQVEISAAGAGFSPIALSNAVAPGSVLRTGANGRAVIENNGDRITVAPNSVFELPVQDRDATMTQVKQAAGTALYDMVPRGIDRFRVETPYLAAVIKGTVFTVNVTPDGAAVEVIRGIVQVANGAGEFAALVYPGQTATTAANLHGEVHVMGRPPATAPKDAAPAGAKPKPVEPPHAQTAPLQHQTANDLHIDNKLAPPPASIGSLTKGLINTIDLPARKSNASASNGTSASSSGSDTASPANPVAGQMASLPDGDGGGGGNSGNGNGGIVASIVSSVAGNDGASVNGGGGGSGGGDNGNGNGNGKGSGNNGNGNGGGNTPAVSASPVVSAPIVSTAPIAALASPIISAPIVSAPVTAVAAPIANIVTGITSGLGVGNGNGNGGVGNGNGKGNAKH